MAALEGISGFTTAASTTFTAPTYSNGTNVVRYFTQGNAYLITVWGSKQASGNIRIRSPRLHDAVSGINMRQDINILKPAVWPLLPLQLNQKLVAQDTLTIELTGSAVAGDIENATLLIYYDYLDSAVARFENSFGVETRMRNQVTLQHALVGGTAGVFGASQALSGAAAGTFKANTDYGLIGYSCSQSATATTACTIGLVGVDTGNLMIPMPVTTDGMTAGQWFMNLSDAIARPAIPVINSANWGGTTLAVLNDENANTVTVTTLWAELAPLQ